VDINRRFRPAGRQKVQCACVELLKRGAVHAQARSSACEAPRQRWYRRSALREAPPRYSRHACQRQAAASELLRMLEAPLPRSGAAEVRRERR